MGAPQMRKALMAALAAAGIAGCGGGADEEYRVEYRVTNGIIFSGSRSAITYSPGPGVVQQTTVSSSWSYTLTAKSGDQLYVSAQNLQASGAIYVTISVNDKTLKSASSSGAYAIATASATCC